MAIPMRCGNRQTLNLPKKLMGLHFRGQHGVNTYLHVAEGLSLSSFAFLNPFTIPRR
ncbi:MAG: hypothetical protein NTY64_03380 [Deltaproteobacteria bacterium]|nr:hypothetical protein [Deltaproteobacteria bacterium]